MAASAGPDVGGVDGDVDRREYLAVLGGSVAGVVGSLLSRYQGRRAGPDGPALRYSDLESLDSVTVVAGGIRLSG
jgi:hypothetical protein